jgi:TusA-related sulfurtransferase
MTVLQPAIRGTNPFGGPATSPWARRSIERFLSGTQARERPEAVLVVGQHGAGKTVLIEELSRAFIPRGACVTVDPNDLAALHPAHADADGDPLPSAAAIIAAHTRRLARSLVRQAVEARRNVVLEVTADEPGPFEAIVEWLQRAGYSVTAIVLDVPPEESWVSLGEREQHWREAMGTSRTVTRGEHDRACGFVPVLRASLERMRGVRLAVIRRDGTVVHGNDPAPPENAATRRRALQARIRASALQRAE